jgi:hypothetical protein
MRTIYRIPILAALIAIISVGVLVTSCGKNKIVVSSDPVQSTISTSAPTLKVYLENSGSMDGYMCAGSQLKDCIYDYVSDLNQSTDTTYLYFINSNVIPCKWPLDSYIKNMNPAIFKSAGGSRANTDISELVNVIIGNMDANDVAMFISDCILDLPAVDAQKFLTRCQISIKNAIINGKKNNPKFAVEIIKMESDFDGAYFYPNGTVEKLKDVKRPYYIWLFGSDSNLAKINKEVSILGINKYGLKGYVAFTGPQQVSFDIMNRNLTSGVINSTKGEYQVTIRADFKTTLLQDYALLDKTNFSFNNQSIAIDGIYPITDPNSQYTHFINFTIPKDAKISEDNLILNAPHLPSWVKESNDETGMDINNHLDQTTGILQLIEGVADAYKKDNTITKLKFNVKRK